MGQEGRQIAAATTMLAEKVQAIVGASGRPEGFDALAWTARWLTEPNPALGGGRPLDLMETMDGQATVIRLLEQMRGGAYT